jgi:hypothetical protein
MNYRNRMSNPRFLSPLGSILLAFGILWPIVFQAFFHLSGKWNEAFRGFLMGVGISFNLIAVVLLRREKQAKQKQDAGCA